MLAKFIAAGLLSFGVASGAQAALIDFTDTSIWLDGSSTDVVEGTTVSLSGPVAQTAYEAPGPIGVLAGLSDGLGTTGSDEISYGGPSITVNFSSAVLVTGLYFLDLFQGAGGLDLESAIATFSDGTVVTTAALSAGGFGYVANNGFAPIATTSITFTPGAGNDFAGVADFALAGIEVAPVPLPAAGWMLAGGLLGLGAMARRKSQA